MIRRQWRIYVREGNKHLVFGCSAWNDKPKDVDPLDCADFGYLDMEMSSSSYDSLPHRYIIPSTGRRLPSLQTLCYLNLREYVFNGLYLLIQYTNHSERGFCNFRILRVVPYDQCSQLQGVTTDDPLKLMCLVLESFLGVVCFYIPHFFFFKFIDMISSMLPRRELYCIHHYL